MIISHNNPESVWPSFPCKFVIGNMNSVRNTAFKSQMARPVWRLPILESGQIYKGGEVGIVLIRWTVTSEQDIPRLVIQTHAIYLSKRRVVTQYILLEMSQILLTATMLILHIGSARFDNDKPKILNLVLHRLEYHVSWFVSRLCIIVSDRPSPTGFRFSFS